ncbi:DUF4349 domain-containing protein [Novipirellula rosea]|uniref:DUF4349 domain-containing protein n=2 Tax=Novipirellula rosea TaxID=1031540 RepID=A0ABP8MQJ9_9BACT
MYEKESTTMLFQSRFAWKRTLVIIMFAVMILGCGESPNSRFSGKLDMVQPATTYESQSGVSAEGTRRQGQSLASMTESTTQRDDGDSDDQTSAKTKSNTKTKRRIIYNTSLGLIVKAYADFEAALPRLVESVDGFISKSETDRRYNDRQSGAWVIRVPVDRYHEFVSGVSGLGFAESRREDAQDVTEEYVDVEARVRNNRKLEDRIITMLEERTGKLSDVLEIERELARVREEIERMEGRLRVLADRTALATVTINVREEKEYVPPAAPTFTDRIAKAFSGSLRSLRQLGESMLIALIALIPWIIALGIPVMVVAAMVRRVIRSRRAI